MWYSVYEGMYKPSVPPIVLARARLLAVLLILLVRGSREEGFEFLRAVCSAYCREEVRHDVQPSFSSQGLTNDSEKSLEGSAE